MMTWCLVVALLAPPPAPEKRPYVWRFDGPMGVDLRAAIEKTDKLSKTQHLLDPVLIDGHLLSRRWPAQLGCFDDSAPCADLTRAVLQVTGVQGRIDASARREVPDDGDEDDAILVVSFTVTPAASDVPVRMYEGRGKTLDKATDEALIRLQNLGTLKVEVDPPDAMLFLDDQPLGHGSGSYVVEAGKHKLRAEAKVRVPVTDEVIIIAADTTVVPLKLPIAYGTLALRYAPVHAHSTLDDKPLGTAPGDFKIKEGRYKIRIYADGFADHARTVRIERDKTFLVDATLKAVSLPLVAKLRQAHPHTRAYNLYAQAGLRLISVGKGDVDFDFSTGGQDQKLSSIDGSVSLVGLDAAVGWRGRLVTVEALGLTLSGGGDKVSAHYDQGARQGSIDGLTRFVVRGAWVGVHYPRWRFDPYISAGPMLALESFDFISDADGAVSGVDHSIFLIGVKAGARYFLDQKWFIASEIEADFWGGERLMLSFDVGGGYAFDLWGSR